eukprot:219263-Amphidinium_carterae.1
MPEMGAELVTSSSSDVTWSWSVIDVKQVAVKKETVGLAKPYGDPAFNSQKIYAEFVGKLFDELIDA